MFDRLFKSEHQRVAEMLSAYLDGELSPEEQALVEKHLAKCADCAENLRTLRQTVALLEQVPPVAVPRAFTIRPAQVAKRPSLFQTRRAYVYLRAATALATVLFAVVLAGDVFLTGLAPHLAPARAPEVIEKEVVVEEGEAPEEVPVTVEVEKEVVVEKKVVETVVVESEAAYAATPLPVPSEKKDEVLTQKPLATPTVAPQEMAPAAATPPTPEKEILAEAPARPGEEGVEIAATPTPLPAEVRREAKPAPTPTAVAEARPPTPIPQEPTGRAVVHPSRLGLAIVRFVEVGLLALVLVLAIATLVARRRQSAR